MRNKQVNKKKKQENKTLCRVSINEELSPSSGH